MKDTLDNLKENQSGKIVALKNRGDVKKRLLEMGVVTGEDIKVEKIAPLGDPIKIKIKGYLLSLRKEEAKSIHVDI